VVHPDGTTLAAGGTSRRIGLWDGSTGKKLAEWQAHDVAVTALAFNPDGRILASGARWHGAPVGRGRAPPRARSDQIGLGRVKGERLITGQASDASGREQRLQEVLGAYLEQDTRLAPGSWPDSSGWLDGLPGSSERF
jgi:hypothetical protein